MDNEKLADRFDASQTPQFLYRQFDSNGALLYVGVTNDVKTRMMQHRQSPWSDRIADFTVDEYSCREDAIAAEKAAVVNERPEFNTVWKPNIPNPGDAASVSQRKAAERRRKRLAGLVPVEVWVPRDKASEIRRIAADMAKDTPTTQHQPEAGEETR